MKRNYIQPTTTISHTTPLSLLMSSGKGSISSNTGFNYNNEGGDATTAF